MLAVHIMDMKDRIAPMNMFAGWDDFTKDIPFTYETPKRISSVDTDSTLLADLAAEIFGVIRQYYRDYPAETISRVQYRALFHGQATFPCFSASLSRRLKKITRTFVRPKEVGFISLCDSFQSHRDIPLHCLEKAMSPSKRRRNTGIAPFGSIVYSQIFFGTTAILNHSYFSQRCASVVPVKH
jgi:hypothetical protein